MLNVNGTIYHVTTDLPSGYPSNYVGLIPIRISYNAPKHTPNEIWAMKTINKGKALLNGYSGYPQDTIYTIAKQVILASYDNENVAGTGFEIGWNAPFLNSNCSPWIWYSGYFSTLGVFYDHFFERDGNDRFSSDKGPGVPYRAYLGKHDGDPIYSYPYGGYDANTPYNYIPMYIVDGSEITVVNTLASWTKVNQGSATAYQDYEYAFISYNPKPVYGASSISISYPNNNDVFGVPSTININGSFTTEGNDYVNFRYSIDGLATYQNRTMDTGGNYTGNKNTQTFNMSFNLDNTVPKGIYTLRIYNVDQNNNKVNSTEITRTIIIDRTPPTPPIINLSSIDWTQQNIIFSIINGADSESGVKKSQYQIDGSTWMDYLNTVTISTEGIYTINARTIDNVGNVSSNTTIQAKIDRTVPYAVINPSSYDGSKTNINYNTNPTDINLAVHLTNIKDNLSGVANIKVWFTDSSTTSATLPGTYFNFDIAAGTSNKDLAVKLPSGDFNRKNIHFQIIDNAGNIFHYYSGIKLEALAPKVPSIFNIRNNGLYVKGENINIGWNYNDTNIPNLPQAKAEIIFNNIETSDIITKTVNGAVTSYEVPVGNFADGITKIKVRVYNLDNKYSESSELIIRINRFNPNGKIVTKTIELVNSIEFVTVKTDAMIPTKTNIKCTLYYWNKNENCFDENHKYIINIASKDDFMQLPYFTNKFKIKYDLNSTDTVNALGTTYAKVSPYITLCKLYGK